MSTQVPGWVGPVMRIGYSARGLVYVVVGVLAVFAAYYGGQAEGTRGALATLTDKSWGNALLGFITLGLFAYAIWRAIDAFLDLENEGDGPKGWVARIGMLVSGIVHLSLGAYAFSLVFSSDGSRGSGTTQSTIAQVLEQPYGQWLVVAAGLATIGAGIYFWNKALNKSYKRNLAFTATSQKLDPLVRFGLMAHGTVVGLIGAFILWAGYTHDASEAGGIGQAFETIRTSLGGQVALGIIGAGLIAFALYCFIEAAYRIVPRRAQGSVTTLADKGRQAAREAQNAARRATN